jgi:hypothetical protein
MKKINFSNGQAIKYEFAGNDENQLAPCAAPRGLQLQCAGKCLTSDNEEHVLKVIPNTACPIAAIAIRLVHHHTYVRARLDKSAEGWKSLLVTTS